jgi:hypothetical protein
MLLPYPTRYYVSCSDYSMRGTIVNARLIVFMYVKKMIFIGRRRTALVNSDVI